MILGKKESIEFMYIYTNHHGSAASFGGQTVAECLYMKLPMLLDVRSKALPWEELNRTLVLKNNFGAAVLRLGDYAFTIQSIIDNPVRIAEWKQNIQKLNLVNPQQEVLKVIKFIFMHQAQMPITQAPTDTSALSPNISTSGQ